jgi:PBP1b-binding outer membrane lipoprotein LpoB
MAGLASLQSRLPSYRSEGLDMNIRALVLCVALAVTGCASAPTGRSEFQRLAALESKTMRGGYPWTQFYDEAIGIIDTLEPDPFLAEMRRHYLEMLGYSRASDSGKITFDEFLLIQKNLLDKTIAKLNTMPRPNAMLMGERQQVSNDAWIAPLVILGATLGGAALAQPRAPAMVTCTTSKVGVYLSTACR